MAVSVPTTPEVKNMLEHQINGAVPVALARRIGAVPNAAGTEDDPLPQTMLDWAIRWALRGLHVFPCKSYLGTPLTPKWYRDATTKIDQLVEWWSEYPDADIAAVPDKSGHFVIAGAGKSARHSFTELERQYGPLSPAFTTERPGLSRHLWFPGRAMTSSNLLGPGLHVRGPGTFVYMPASLAPDPE